MGYPRSSPIPRQPPTHFANSSPFPHSPYHTTFYKGEDWNIKIPVIGEIQHIFLPTGFWKCPWLRRHLTSSFQIIFKMFAVGDWWLVSQSACCLKKKLSSSSDWNVKMPFVRETLQREKVYYIFDDKRLELSHLDAVDMMGRTRVAESWELGSNSPIFWPPPLPANKA